MSSNLKDVFGLIETLEKSLDGYQQFFQKTHETLTQDLGTAWKRMKDEQKEIEDFEAVVRSQNSELTELKLKSDELDKKLDELQKTKSELTSKISELKSSLEKVDDELKAPQLELENLISKLNSLNQKITSKEDEKSAMDQKKLDYQNRENYLTTTYTQEKMADLDTKLSQLKRNNFFTSFLIENSEEKIPEVDIIATIMTQGSVSLDELKKLLDVPPIMAVRTIKQLAIAGIINLDENTNIITMP
ncbi:MAG: hypothetical protein ACFFDX_12590 [Candidatus Odinarchaeota archaeon]